MEHVKYKIHVFFYYFNTKNILSNSKLRVYMSKIFREINVLIWKKYLI